MQFHRQLFHKTGTESLSLLIKQIAQLDTFIFFQFVLAALAFFYTNAIGKQRIVGDVKTVHGNAAKAAGNKSAATAAPKNAPNPAPAPSAKPSRRRKRRGSGNAAGSAATAIAAPAATAEAPQKKWWKRWL